MIKELYNLIQNTNKEIFVSDEQNRTHKINILKWDIKTNEKYYDYIIYSNAHRKYNTLYSIMIQRLKEEEDKITLYL